ncbi:hypothetical protein BD309DRAFT_987034 [Dichomitus squalens]|uniref:Uncharacterized protein n=1 Tax=Dichomitus squalens TaxID=114155 RepID=A0A4Q9PTM6_9APHY|nr:hypothetical protein BD309DRAFT_987034 [Dichomitus squalens]TBU57823.1 hypothetical protein BD310DRAFT_820781 [Dichomitus squalens]
MADQGPRPEVKAEAVALLPNERRPGQRLEVVLPLWRDLCRARAARAQSEQAHATRLEERDEENAKFGVGLLIDEHHPPQGDLRAAVEEMKNPDIKIKEELLLSDNFLLNALTWEGINHRYPIPVPKEIAEFGYRRDYISHLYGGCPQDVYPRVDPDKVEWHGIDDWAFLLWNGTLTRRRAQVTQDCTSPLAMQPRRRSAIPSSK